MSVNRTRSTSLSVMLTDHERRAFDEKAAALGIPLRELVLRAVTAFHVVPAEDRITDLEERVARLERAR